MAESITHTKRELNGNVVFAACQRKKVWELIYMIAKDHNGTERKMKMMMMMTDMIAEVDRMVLKRRKEWKIIHMTAKDDTEKGAEKKMFGYNNNVD